MTSYVSHRKPEARGLAGVFAYNILRKYYDLFFMCSLFTIIGENIWNCYNAPILSVPLETEQKTHYK